MKKVFLLIYSAFASFLFSSSLLASDIKVSFTDKKWDGEKIPLDEVCSNYNVEAGSTPGLYIENLPDGAKKVILKFNDKTFTKMDNGGHGILSFDIEENATNVEIPPQIGETFELDEGFSVVNAHTGTRFGKQEGAYLAPCSGGKGNTYSVDISIVDSKGKVLTSKELVLGKY
ncbi:hypothetical protein Arnit_1245 [Arcobacter nitrofigilis DSM 7299]|uniref:Uncharacterized protein n=1 Tax=Arcobacter nitrofigilis (strain ATCC 33309 / DSM 7299 / CCUG 15893 / LMG 7604 / NCTC 12251 / CI) TaxID=572480 RepID=D5V4J8_ARCNC|nr:hypothetical protein [Arcobacter nitrofigilis]ADG92903.1 hypothetical protein Arnit_1245 [Arcobacter nitrofigilis DSM 7299]